MRTIHKEIPLVTEVHALDDGTLGVRFARDKREYHVNLRGLFARSSHFMLLGKNPEAFARVAIIENGLGLAWPVETRWGYLDISAWTVRRLASSETHGVSD
jgi:hypothetical protein